MFIILDIYLCNLYHMHAMSTSRKTIFMKEGKTNNSEHSPEKKKLTHKQIRLSNLTSQSSSSSLCSTTHQQQYSPSSIYDQQSKIGLDAIHENREYLSKNSQHQYSMNIRFPRSSTVPYPVYGTVRSNDGNYFLPSQYYYADNGRFIQGTVSPEQLHTYYNTRQPFSLINTNFQPISPHHHQYGTRPVDILKPTFLIVSKAAEQKLAAQLSASNSPVSTISNKKISMTKKNDTKQPQKTVTGIEKITTNSS